MPIPRQRILMPAGAGSCLTRAAARREVFDGPDVARFEQGFSETTGATHAVAVSSGRAGLRAILESIDLEPGAEVICSAYGYPVVPHLVRHMGYTLKLVDCEMQTLGLDADKLDEAITDRTGAIIATHLFGVPCRIDRIAEVARRRGVTLVEDCAHCLCATVDGTHVGAYGDVGYFSFETSKVINTLGGGMVTTNDEAIAERIRARVAEEKPKSWKWLLKRLAKTGFERAVTSPVLFDFGVYPALRVMAARHQEDRFASGYQADHFTLAGRTGLYTNYQAMLGLRQLQGVQARHKRRVAKAERLIDQLQDVATFQHPADNASPNYMLVTGLFADRSAVASRLLRRGVDTKYHYMRDCSRALETGESFACASRAEAEVLHVPAHPQLSDRQIDRVASCVRQALSAADQPLSQASAKAVH